MKEIRVLLFYLLFVLPIYSQHNGMQFFCNGRWLIQFIYVGFVEESLRTHVFDLRDTCNGNEGEGGRERIGMRELTYNIY
jgi:hypothetical protein